jgi:hypothetical protein
MAANTRIRVWLSHDGYRDPDDNLSVLVGSAQARLVANGTPTLTVAGVVFGDTKDGGQYYTLNPTGKAPKAFGTDSRYGDTAGNKVAAGNYEFFKDYVKPGLKAMAPGWVNYDLLADDKGGMRAWNFDATARSGISKAAAALADDIREAIAHGNEKVVYSAGGGANVPAEAIGFLYNQGFRAAAIAEHFAVVQHGRSNWGNQYENEARDITREYTIAISNQNLARYANGMDGPDLKHAIPNAGQIDGSAFGSAFDRALDVAMGVKAYSGLKAGTTFKSTRDASDAGSHAFSVDVDRLLGAWDKQMVRGDNLPNGDAWAHRIDGANGARLRVMFNQFDSADIRQLLDGDKKIPLSAGAPAPAPEVPSGGTDGETDGETDGGTGGGTDGGNGGGTAGFVAPFSTAGAGTAVDGATLYGFAADGGRAEVVRAGGKIGVAAHGDANEIDHHGTGSETIGLDFGAAVEAIVLQLAGLGSKDGGREAARLTAYDADGDVLDSVLLRSNGASYVAFDEEVRYATLEAADWIDGHSVSEPDFALISLGLDYV